MLQFLSSNCALLKPHSCLFESIFQSTLPLSETYYGYLHISLPVWSSIETQTSCFFLPCITCMCCFWSSSRVHFFITMSYLWLKLAISYTRYNVTFWSSWRESVGRGWTNIVNSSMYLCIFIPMILYYIGSYK